MNDPVGSIKIFGFTVILGAVLGYVTNYILITLNYTGGLWSLVPILFAVIPIVFGLFFLFS